MGIKEKFLKWLHTRPERVRFEVHGDGVVSVSAEEILKTQKAQKQLEVLSKIEVPWSPKI